MMEKLTAVVVSNTNHAAYQEMYNIVNKLLIISDIILCLFTILYISMVWIQQLCSSTYSHRYHQTAAAICRGQTAPHARPRGYCTEFQTQFHM